MKFLLLLAGLCHLSLVIGSPDAEARFSQSDVAVTPESLAMSADNDNIDASSFQTGGPGSSSSSSSSSYSYSSRTPVMSYSSRSSSPSSSSYSYSSRTPVMRSSSSSSSYSYGSQGGYQAGNAGKYTKPWPVQSSSASMEGYQADESNMGGFQAVSSSMDGFQSDSASMLRNNYGAYGSISMPETGNVQEDMGFGMGGSRPNSNYPLMPYNSRPNYINSMPLNSQGNMYTRAYTPLNNGCTNVCSMRRPITGVRPSCTNTCSQIRAPCYQGVTQGSTRLCNPRPPMNPLPCGGGWNGGREGRCNIAPDYSWPQPSPCSSGGCSSPPQPIWSPSPPRPWPQPSPCSSGGCGAPPQTWPMQPQPQPWTPPQASPCSSGGCTDTQPQYPQWNTAQATAPREPIPEGWNTSGDITPVDPIP